MLFHCFCAIDPLDPSISQGDNKLIINKRAVNPHSGVGASECKNVKLGRLKCRVA